MAVSAPTSVQVEITEKCNHRCSHCYNPGRSSGSNPAELSRGQIDRIVSELAENKVWHVTITGGEPLACFDKVAYFKNACDSVGLDTSMNTNLSLLTDDLAERMSKELRWKSLILTSLPSLDEGECDAITGVRGSQKNILAGILACKKAGIEVGINMVVKPDSLDRLAGVAEFVAEYSPDYLAITRAIAPVGCSEGGSYSFSREDLLFVADALIELKERFESLEVGSLIPFPLCVLKDQAKYAELLSTKCCAGLTECTITASGDVKACSHEGGSYGNIFESDLSSIWRNMCSWRSGFSLAEQCLECSHLDLCGGECRMIAETSLLDPLAEIALSGYEPFHPLPKPIQSLSFSRSESAKTRKEAFGCALHIGGSDYMLTEEFAKLEDLMVRLGGSFSYGEIANALGDISSLDLTVRELVRIGYLNVD